MQGRPLKNPAQRVNRIPPGRGEWVDLVPLTAPVLESYPAAWRRREARALAIPKWLWDKWREDPVTSQWSPGDHALALELGASYYTLKPELRFKLQTHLGLNATGRRNLRWRNAAETESAAKADAHAAEVRRLRIVAKREEKT
jgi:hypothetical protein